MKVYKCVFSGDELCSDSYEHLVPFGDEAFKNGKSLIHRSTSYSIPFPQSVQH